MTASVVTVVTRTRRNETQTTRTRARVASYFDRCSLCTLLLVLFLLNTTIHTAAFASRCPLPSSHHTQQQHQQEQTHNQHPHHSYALDECSSHTATDHSLQMTSTADAADVEVNNDSNNDTPPDTTRACVIGVTGGIGSGKSTACQELSHSTRGGDTDNNSKNIYHIDADATAHGLYQNDPQLVDQMRAAFGPSIFDTQNGQQQVDRKALGALVFGNATARQQLEDLVWPATKRAVWKQMQEILDQTKASSIDTKDDNDNDYPIAIIIVEAALLLQAGWNDWLDATWVVNVSREVALERLVHGPRQLDRADAERRMAAQATQYANNDNTLITAVVDNSGTLTELQTALQATLEQTIREWKQQPQQRAPK